ncbi:hypothetical protein N9934_04340 [Desulfosarcina sp.]|nr:hypothetical protein [Desulfosarcina sp.]
MKKENKKVIETFGTISKKETLASVEEEFSNGALVLESKDPFPGYYHLTIPDQNTLIPTSIFLITRKVHNEEDIMRLSHDIRKTFNKSFDATIGEVVLFNETRQCIRVKFLQDFKDIPALVDLYRKHGIQFLKSRKVKPYYGLIKIRKYFVLETPEPGLYNDNEEPQMCYIQIPNHLKWNEFEKLTVSLKRNLEDNKFDAAIGTIYRKNCLVDIVRIYAEDIDENKVKLLKAKYVEAVKKWKLK